MPFFSIIDFIAVPSFWKYYRILDIYAKLYGETDGRVGMAMCSLANVKCAKGNISNFVVYIFIPNLCCFTVCYSQTQTHYQSVSLCVIHKHINCCVAGELLHEL